MGKLFLTAILFTLLSCSSDEDPVDCEKSGLIVNVDDVISASGCSTQDGAILASLSGGKEPYRLLLNDLEVDEQQLKSLSAGVYSIGVKDANNCTSYVNNVMIYADDFSFTTTIQPNTSCESGNGEVEIVISSNNPPYSFKLGNGTFSSEDTFNGLGTGNHTVTVRDNSNCMVILTITIPRGFTGVSWASDVQPILEMNCAISGCHNGISRSNDFRKYASAKEFAKTIKSKTQDRSMPFDGSLTPQQIELIACWVDDGAVQN